MPAVLDRAGIGVLIEALAGRGYRVVGPTVRDGAVVLGELRGSEQLPVGWTDLQRPGGYRLARREDEALFGFNVGPQSWRQFLFPARVRLWHAERLDGDDFRILGQEDGPAPQLALFGARACDLHAIAIQDRVFLDGPHIDPIYQRRRNGVFVVAVNCTQAGETCFCVSQGAGPRASFGYDLALTEVLDGDMHWFLVETGSEEGEELLRAVEHRPALPREVTTAERRIEAAATSMGRSLENDGIRELLRANYEHPRWAEVAERCLACANCTLVCPTCFCSNVEDTSDVTGNHAERWRTWDSCFTMDHSYLHGGSVRASVSSRYRQWLTHKLATWIDQFGTSGCVGCGRCITWCPVGIDLTEEAAAIRATDLRKPLSDGGSGGANDFDG
jgi:ferredoxin